VVRVHGSVRRWGMGRKARLEVILDCSDPEKLMGF
jgi:hypothetical protein